MLRFKVTLIKGKTCSCGGYVFDIDDPKLKTQIVDLEAARTLEHSGRFRIEKIEASKMEMITSTSVENIEVKKPDITFLVEHISLSDGYGCLGNRILKKYPTVVQDVRDNLDDSISKGKALSNIPLGEYIIQLTSPNRYRKLEGFKKRFGFTMFETTKIPKSWPKSIKETCDELIVPAKEVKKVFKKCGVKIPIHVVPLWVDDCYQYFERPKRNLFKFLHVGTLDTFDRKGCLIVAEAFKQEFKKENDVRLLIKCTNLTLNSAKIRQITQDKRIKLIKELYSDKEMNELYQSVDCLVYPTHGEGFGLPPLEAMATGLCSIVTDWMGCREFVNGRVCYPIEVRSLEESLYPEDYGDVGDWAAIDIKDVKRKMRHAYEHPKIAKRKGVLAAEFVNSWFRFKHFSKALEKVIKPEDVTGLVKIGFVPHQSIDRKQIAAGTRIRVLNIVKQLKNCVVSYDYEELKDCDVVIFQARWLKGDIELARKLKERGVKLMFDTTDPHWDTMNFDVTGIKRKAFDELLKYISIVMFPTKELYESFLKYRQDKRVEIIPDCIDLKDHRKIKKHKKKKQYVIAWYGCRVNICSADLARKDLEKLGKEFNLKMIAVYDRGYGIEFEPYKNLELEIREWSDEVTIKTILESDVVINPRFEDWRRYKSHNKTIKAWALGVPCVEKNYYKEIKRYLLSTRLRNKEGKRGKEIAAKFSSKKIAKKISDLCNELVNKKISKRKRKKKIAVVTAIVGRFDRLHEPEYYDENVDYFAFVDQKINSNIWKVIPVEYTHFKQPRMSAKIYKILIHKYFKYDYLVWIDGSLVLTDSVTELINKFLNDADMALFKHRFRSCVYEEHLASLKNRQHAVGEPLSVRKAQIEKYKNEGLPKKFGLYECTFILRKNNKRVQKFNNDWWGEVSIASSSDQVPFMYALWKNPNVKVATIAPGDSHNSKWAYYIKHG